MVLRDLRHRRIARGDDGDHLGQRRMGQARPAIGLGHVDRPDAALRIEVQLAQRKQPLAVAQGGVAGEVGGQILRDADRLVVAGQDMGRGGGQRPGRHRIGGVDARMDRMVDRIGGRRAHDGSFVLELAPVGAWAEVFSARGPRQAGPDFLLGRRAATVFSGPGRGRHQSFPAPVPAADSAARGGWSNSAELSRRSPEGQGFFRPTH